MYRRCYICLHMDSIRIKGARQHNLKNIDVRIPKNKLVTITGVSGSGKTSLAIDTLFAEGQRRYAESLNSYVRQFLARLPKPEVDGIENLCPAISIDQKVVRGSSRSTVGTLSEVYDYLKLLFARVGHTYSPVSGKEVKKDTPEDVWDYLTELPAGQRFLLLFPIDKPKKEMPAYLELLLRQGYVRLWDAQDDEIRSIESVLEEKRFGAKQKYYIIKDRGKTKENWSSDDQMRWVDGIESVFHEGGGSCFLWVDGEYVCFDSRYELDGMSFEQPSVDLFSFNNSYGACDTCEGFGSVLGISEELVIPDPSLSLYENAVACWRGDKQSRWKKDFIRDTAELDFPIHKPIRELSTEQYKLLWEGAPGVKGIDDFFVYVRSKMYKIQYRVLLSRYRARTRCPECKGTRVRPDASYVQIDGASIIDVLLMSVRQVKEWMAELKISKTEMKIAEGLLQEIGIRVDIMCDIGLDYLQLSRSADTLSGGESQRIQLTRIIGSNLSESLYVLDEPSIGLHPRDSMNLLEVLRNLKKLNNTVVVVEHEEVIIRNSDYIIDMGPAAGRLGGEVVEAGSISALRKNHTSLTTQYLFGDKQVSRKIRDQKPLGFLEIKGVSHHNLKDIDLRFPYRRLVSVCGVSGSGKSSLMRDVVYPAVARSMGLSSDREGRYRSLDFDPEGIENIEFIDQNPIGKSSRSNPITYIKVYDDIRKLYASQKLSKIRGYKPGYFSFNTDGGRCEKCMGEGEITVKMQFLADVQLVCDVCQGRQFHDDVLEVEYLGKNIHQLLRMTIADAYEFFSKEPRIQAKLLPLVKVGLGYMQMGQSSSTLSGGEAQRVKMASYLYPKKNQEKILFIFDEPTTGLHFEDIQNLLIAFDELLSIGHSIVLIEHNLDIIRQSDWVIELGPEGGDGGGYVLYQGPGNELKKSKKSVTAKYL